MLKNLLAQIKTHPEPGPSWSL
uniref:Uncharacterized protein n=1 Tax=Anguilla anguilla TaxID=7936 RepID=A0A0E9UMD1_ANGAN